MRTGLLLAALMCTAPAAAQRPDIVYEKSISELQGAMTSGTTSSVALVDAYLARIAAYDQAGPKLNAMIRINPKARADAAALDAERRAGRVRGPMHGIPVIVKDNYGTVDMPTTAGSIAFAGLQTPFDAFQVKKLREAGAVILGKANMHELASGIITIGSMGGQTCNPYDPDRYPGGSSGGSGVAAAASFAAIVWGSDTCGSIRIPSAYNNLFGLRPTKGLSSIDGLFPLSHTQDVGGPLARTVMDLAIGLDATVGPDPADPATKILDGVRLPRFVESLDTASLRGARIGVLTSLFGSNAPEDQEVGRIVRRALDRMKARGAEIVDVTVPGLDSALLRTSVIDFEMKLDVQDFLARVPDAPVKSLTELLDRGLLDIHLEGGIRARNGGGARDGDGHRTALKRAADVRALMVRFLDDNRLDAVAYPTMTRVPARIGDIPQRGTTCTLSAISGLPAISMPAGFANDSLPLGVELLGRPLADARLVAFASDYERAAKPRRPPVTTPPLVDGKPPKPATFTASVMSGGVTLRGTFRADPSWLTLDYDATVTGVAREAVYAISLDRADSAGVARAMLFHLGGIGATSARGAVKLGMTERNDLRAGRVILRVFTKEKPDGSVRASLKSN